MSEVASLVSHKRAYRPLRSGRPLTVYLKLSDYCNVGCDHCYLPLSVRQDRTRMNSETLDNALDAVERMAGKQNSIGVIIVWHGGEPLALAPEFVEAACSRAAERLPDAIQSIQTSLIPYRDAWRPVIERYLGSEIGSSIDFTQRTLRGSAKEYQDFWLRKVAMARSHGFRIIPGVVPSVKDIPNAAEITDWMINNGFDAWNIDRYNSFGGEDPLRPVNRLHSRFLTAVFDRVMHHAGNGTFQKVNTVTAALGGVLFDSPGDRWGGKCSMDFLVVNPDGKTHACPDKISFEGFSNINEGFQGFESSDARKQWIRLHMTGHRNNHCGTCRFNTFCKSGCPLTPNAPETEGECSGYHSHLEHVYEFARKNPLLVQNYLKEVSG